RSRSPGGSLTSALCAACQGLLCFGAPRLGFRSTSAPLRRGRGHLNPVVIDQSGRADATGDDGEHLTFVEGRARWRECVGVDELEILELDVMKLGVGRGDDGAGVALACGDRSL